jgi:hypothetical protein
VVGLPGIDRDLLTPRGLLWAITGFMSVKTLKVLGIY